MNWTKKTEVIPEIKGREVDGAEVWVVEWNKFKGEYRDSPSLVHIGRGAKAFLSEEDAYAFKKSLEDALELLQATIYLNIVVTKQI